MARKIYRVTPSGTRWELRNSGSVLYSHDNKAPVVSQGQPAPVELPLDLVE